MIVTIGICSCNCSRSWYCSAEVACLPFFFLESTQWSSKKLLKTLCAGGYSFPTRNVLLQNSQIPKSSIYLGVAA